MIEVDFLWHRILYQSINSVIETSLSCLVFATSAQSVLLVLSFTGCSQSKRDVFRIGGVSYMGHTMWPSSFAQVWDSINLYQWLTGSWTGHRAA